MRRIEIPFSSWILSVVRNTYSTPAILGLEERRTLRCNMFISSWYEFRPLVDCAPSIPMWTASSSFVAFRHQRIQEGEEGDLKTCTVSVLVRLHHDCGIMSAQFLHRPWGESSGWSLPSNVAAF